MKTRKKLGLETMEGELEFSQEWLEMRKNFSEEDLAIAKRDARIYHYMDNNKPLYLVNQGKVVEIILTNCHITGLGFSYLAYSTKTTNGIFVLNNIDFDRIFFSKEEAKKFLISEIDED